ncbi:type V CRISPR-associated protein Cas12a/Cpf1 [Xylanibacter caecicola]|uniref:type V CRISPR-associated protein Cas12a/Cpf1 n=1 Tax=Xylanibacter caecicola TaxID=2736294 RepID=UPI00257D2212|nr:type V CRISPR-associated protein Cas12a/Cpf1 [Xylanibacter caecicola]
MPITINFKAKGDERINFATLDAIRDGEIEHVIGIDRGERHLLYLSLIDLRGNIVKQFTLNEIVNEYNGRTYSTDYKDLLVSREGSRDEARRNWQKIENIREIKEGYLSQVVHIIAKMMVDYKAIVVLEDLNKGFMRGRQKIERQVYEKFEKMLIDKLNCYVDKQKDADDIGGVLHPLQLTDEFKSFRKLGKQSGWLFYIPAWNTSKIDPVTGYVNMLDTRYENADKTRCFFSKFDIIRYNAEKDWFEFTFDYTKFTDKANSTQTKWTLCTYGTRIKTFRNPKKNNQWDSEEVVLTNEFKKVFSDAGIDVHGNLKDAICSLTEKKHLEPLMHLMKLLLQMRNSETGTEVDYLVSPVADADGNFYDSRKNIATLPKDADANGAYNIARKGLWVIRKIQSTPNGDKLNLTISNKEWLQFAQQKPYLDE